MLLADKITALRRKNGWSQEDLAEKVGISRQAVSKWESAQAMPDLEKIKILSDLFGVSTDYLLKETEKGFNQIEELYDTPPRRVDEKEACAFLQHTKHYSFWIAVAVFICIISPITLIILGGIADEAPEIGISENTAAVIGLVALFALLLCAIPIFVSYGYKSEKYEYLKGKVPFKLDRGAIEIINFEIEEAGSKYAILTSIGICICVASPIPLILTSFCNNDLLSLFMTGVLLFLVGLGTFLIVFSEIRTEAYKLLLNDGNFKTAKRRVTDLGEAVMTAFWGLAVAIYLAISFSTDAWHITSIVFVIAGVLTPLVSYFCDLFSSKKQ